MLSQYMTQNIESMLSQTITTSNQYMSHEGFEYVWLQTKGMTTNVEQRLDIGSKTLTQLRPTCNRGLPRFLKYPVLKYPVTGTPTKGSGT